LAARIAERGFEVVRLPTDELLKGGGGAKCCVLEWHPA
jgi:N-dimethylarginine dimethylaminohydrolase